MMTVTSKTQLADSSSAGVRASLSPMALGYASGLALLSRFAQLMADDGLAVDTRRMQTDAIYTFERLGLAHTSTYAALRECSIRVFALFQE